MAREDRVSRCGSPRRSRSPLLPRLLRHLPRGPRRRKDRGDRLQLAANPCVARAFLLPPLSPQRYVRDTRTSAHVSTRFASVLARLEDEPVQPRETSVVPHRCLLDGTAKSHTSEGQPAGREARGGTPRRSRRRGRALEPVLPGIATCRESEQKREEKPVLAAAVIFSSRPGHPPAAPGSRLRVVRNRRGLEDGRPRWALRNSAARPISGRRVVCFRRPTRPAQQNTCKTGVL